MRLGRLPHDPAAVARMPSLAGHAFAGTPVPPKLDRSATDFTPGMFGNDTIPDCTAAGLANAVSAVATVAGYAPVIDPTLVPVFYAACVGCDPTHEAMAATDGAVMLDVLMRQQRSGFDVGQQEPLVGQFGRLTLDRLHLAAAMNRLGHAYLGVTLHDADMALPPVIDLSDAMGAVAGGHCIVAWDYGGLRDTDTVRVATWGQWQRVTWRWLLAALDEAWGLAWAPAPAGVDMAALELALRQVTV